MSNNNATAFPNAAQITEMVIDQWVNSCNVVAKTHEQAENTTRMWMDQGRAVREQSQKAVLQIADQAKENQRLFQEMVTSTVRLGLESYRIATQKNLSEMSKRVDELTQQVETLTRKGQAKVAAN
jgi:polyhydroxyalkanoate synthesis regulator phasin